MKKFYNFMTCCIKKSKQILDFSLIVLDLMKTQDQCDGTGEKKAKSAGMSLSRIHDLLT